MLAGSEFNVTGNLECERRGVHSPDRGPEGTYGSDGDNQRLFAGWQQVPTCALKPGVVPMPRDMCWQLLAPR